MSIAAPIRNRTAALVGGSPNTFAEPSAGSTRPASTRNNVDLPDPFSPWIPTIAPGGSTKSTPESTSVPPSDAEHPRSSAAAVMPSVLLQRPARAVVEPRQAPYATPPRGSARSRPPRTRGQTTLPTATGWWVEVTTPGEDSAVIASASTPAGTSRRETPGAAPRTPSEIAVEPSTPQSW